MSLFTLWSLHVTHRFSTREFFIFPREMIKITNNTKFQHFTNRYVPNLPPRGGCTACIFAGKVEHFFLFLKFFVNFHFPNFETLLPELFGIRAVTDTRDSQTKQILIILNRTINKNILVVGSVDPYVTRIIV